MKEKFCFVIAVMTVITCILTACVGEEQTSLILNNTSITMKIGEVLSLQAKSTDGKSEKELQWSSDNSSVVEVSSNGEIKAISKGKAKVSVMNSEGVQARCDVTVENVEIESIQLNCLKKSISVNKSVSLNAKIYPDNATDREVQWLSEDSDIADVNSNGLVTGKKAGTVNIICRSNNGKQASCTIVVKKKKVKKNSTESEIQVNNTVDEEIPFYGIWCGAAKSYSEAKRESDSMRSKGIDANVYITSQWSNLNKEKWYVVSAGSYESKAQAEVMLDRVKEIYPSAYIKYSGKWQG